MPPNKRHNRPGDVEHRGRVTKHRDPLSPPAASPSSVTKRRVTGRAAPVASSRYTPPIKSVRFRPDWHKRIGFILLMVGIAIVILNDLVLLGAGRSLLPGGHNEFYLLLGLTIAGYSTWWFGWFDREQ